MFPVSLVHIWSECVCSTLIVCLSLLFFVFASLCFQENDLNGHVLARGSSPPVLRECCGCVDLNVLSAG